MKIKPSQHVLCEVKAYRAGRIHCADNSRWQTALFVKLLKYFKLLKVVMVLKFKKIPKKWGIYRMKALIK